MRIFRSNFFEGFSISIEDPKDLDVLKKFVSASRMTVNIRKRPETVDTSQIEAFLSGGNVQEKEGEL